LQKALKRLGSCGSETPVLEAIRWYRKAAEAGNEEARKRLRQLGRR
jgi:TPR repeat protein